MSLTASRRAARLEAALRDNLKKRKDQSRSRRAGETDQAANDHGGDLEK